MTINETQPLSVDVFHDRLPKDRKSPTESVRAYIDELSFPTVGRRSLDSVPPSISPLQEGEKDINIVGAAGDMSGSSVDGIAAALGDRDGYKSRMRMIRCQLYLLRCEILQSTG
jgi:hypothetical protein